MLPFNSSEKLDDTVCPQCRHVFTVPQTSCHTSPSPSTATTTITTLPKLDLSDLDDDYSIEQLLLDNSELRPPTPPPRLKPVITYANLPSTSKPLTKSYVTMSNINLNNSQPATFVPLSAPSSPTLPLSSPKARVYRQLSGGGLINTTNNNMKIHELQPLHQMCGGGLIQRPMAADEELFPMNSLIIRPTQIIIPSTSNNISIVVPRSSTSRTSLEITQGRINITTTPTEPRTPVTTNHLQPVDDFDCLSKTMYCLKESGWFHEGLSWNDSEALLTGSKSGTFVVRESLNPNFLFAITVQTQQKEPTSVRVQYSNGKFRLDCVTQVTPIVPRFRCVVDLIEYYVMRRHKKHIKGMVMNQGGEFSNILTNQVFVDEHGNINSAVLLRKPLRSNVPSLMHFARISINKQLRKHNKSLLVDKIDQLILPKSLKKFLENYPYVI